MHETKRGPSSFWPAEGVSLGRYRMLVERHDGDICTDLERVDGATVYFTLPAFEGHDG